MFYLTSPHAQIRLLLMVAMPVLVACEQNTDDLQPVQATTWHEKPAANRGSLPEATLVPDFEQAWITPDASFQVVPLQVQVPENLRMKVHRVGVLANSGSRPGYFQQILEVVTPLDYPLTTVQQVVSQYLAKGTFTVNFTGYVLEYSDSYVYQRGTWYAAGRKSASEVRRKVDREDAPALRGGEYCTDWYLVTYDAYTGQVYGEELIGQTCMTSTMETLGTDSGGGYGSYSPPPSCEEATDLGYQSEFGTCSLVGRTYRDFSTGWVSAVSWEGYLWSPECLLRGFDDFSSVDDDSANQTVTAYYRGYPTVGIDATVLGEEFTFDRRVGVYISETITYTGLDPRCFN